MKDLHELIKILGDAPDNVLDKMLAKECREFEGSDPIRFLYDLRDKVVRYGAGSQIMFTLLNPILDKHPETEEEAEKRRRVIEAEEQGLTVEQLDSKEIIEA
jgi:hypothetical protein